MQEVINNREQTCNWYGIDLARDSFEEVDRKVGEHQGMLRRANGCRSLTDVGWSVEGALVRRPPHTMFADVVDKMYQVGFCRQDPDRLYPERLSVLIAFNLTRPDLDLANQRGAAWAVIRWGMWARRWELVDDVKILVPSPALFDEYTTAEDLALLIRDCYRPSPFTLRS